MVNRDPLAAAPASSGAASSARTVSTPDPEVCLALAEVVPPFVHHLNNALATVIGLTDLVAHRPDREDAGALLKTVGEQAELCVARIRSLSDLAKTGERSEEIEDLGALLERAEYLVEPLAAALGCELRVASPSGAVPARFDARLALQWLVSASLDLLRAHPEGSPSLEWALAGEAEAPELCVQLSTAAAGEWTRTAETLTDLGQRAGAADLWRSPDGRALRLAFGGSAPSQAATSAASGAICVLEGDPHLAGLLPDVLEESGFRARGAADAADALGQVEPGGVLLVDSRLTGDWLDEARARGARVGLLGRPERAEGGALPAIERPFGPQELLAFVSELSGDR
ncbi:MAG: hypothetical protein ACYS26_05150 [Planctomycetota bacterium]|jgi:hypothetical protein